MKTNATFVAILLGLEVAGAVVIPTAPTVGISTVTTGDKVYRRQEQDEGGSIDDQSGGDDRDGRGLFGSMFKKLGKEAAKQTVNGIASGATQFGLEQMTGSSSSPVNASPANAGPRNGRQLDAGDGAYGAGATADQPESADMAKRWRSIPVWPLAEHVAEKVVDIATSKTE